MVEFKKGPIGGFKKTTPEKKEEKPKEEPKQETKPDVVKETLDKMDDAGKTNAEKPVEKEPEKKEETASNLNQEDFDEVLKKEIEKCSLVLDEMVEKSNCKAEDKEVMKRNLSMSWNENLMKAGKQEVIIDNIFINESKILFKFVNEKGETAIKSYDLTNDKGGYFLKKDCTILIKKMGVDPKLFSETKKAVAWLLSVTKKEEIVFDIEVELVEGKQSKYTQVTLLG